MSRVFIVFLTLCCVLHRTEAFAAPAKSSKSFEITGTEIYKIESATLGRTYDIYIKVPSDYTREENAKKIYPVIYMNDGPYPFLVAAGVTHMRKMDKAILVGISFAQGENGMASRVRDLTPEVDNNWTKYKTGGASQFLKFIETDIMTFIENNYRADPTRRIFAGQSLGGSFGAWVLFTKPNLFSACILTSPSLWFKNYMIFDLEKRYAETNEDLQAKVYFATGEYETPIYGMKNDMVGGLKKFTHHLRSRKYPNLVMHEEIVNGATHVTTFPIGFTKGLLWLFADTQ